MTFLLKKLVPELQLLMVPFGTNLVSNISTKESTIFNAHFAIFGVQIRCKFNGHFCWAANDNCGHNDIHLLFI